MLWRACRLGSESDSLTVAVNQRFVKSCCQKVSNPIGNRLFIFEYSLSSLDVLPNLVPLLAF